VEACPFVPGVSKNLVPATCLSAGTYGRSDKGIAEKRLACWDALDVGKQDFWVVLSNFGFSKSLYYYGDNLRPELVFNADASGVANSTR
jgi:hypothetical protein